jgi:hypothetical protein
MYVIVSILSLLHLTWYASGYLSRLRAVWQRFHSWGKQELFLYPTASYWMCPDHSPWVKRPRRYLIVTLRMQGAIPPFPHVFKRGTKCRGNFTQTFITSLLVFLPFPDFCSHLFPTDHFGHPWSIKTGVTGKLTLNFLRKRFHACYIHSELFNIFNNTQFYRVTAKMVN